jgi:hypothetical protein
MTDDEPLPVLYVITCAAAPAPYLGRLIDLAQADGWRVYVIATPSAVPFLDVDEISAKIGAPVFSDYRRPSEAKRQPPADAAVVARPPTTRSTSGPRASPTTTPWAPSPN